MQSLITFVCTVMCLLNFAIGAALPETTPAPQALPSLTCTLVDGGQVGGTFCNRYIGTSTLTDTVWVTTVTPWAKSTSTSTGEGSSSAPPPPPPPPASTPTSSEPTATASNPAPGVTGCGEVGTFNIDFDDLPPAGIPSNANEGPPIFSPADHFYWGDSWTYGPPPTEPYRPQSGDHLGHSVGDGKNKVTGPSGPGKVPTKGFGAGPRNANQFYWFNPRSAYVQCDFSDASAATQCDFTATAYQYNAQLREDRVVATQHWAQTRCTANECDLNEIVFDEPFSNLSAVSFYGVIQGAIVDFYMDTISLDWYDDSCAAGQARASSRK